LPKIFVIKNSSQSEEPKVFVYMLFVTDRQFFALPFTRGR